MFSVTAYTAANNRKWQLISFASISCDEPEIIAELIEQHPEFGPMYEHIYDVCRNMEKVMGMFSEELRILDRNTVQLMIDDMKDKIEKQQEKLDDITEENQTLATENQTLATENQTLTAENQTLTTENQTLAAENQSMKISAQVWKLKARGCSEEEIMQKTGLSADALKEIIEY